MEYLFTPAGAIISAVVAVGGYIAYRLHVMGKTPTQAIADGKDRLLGNINDRLDSLSSQLDQAKLLSKINADLTALHSKIDSVVEAAKK